LQSKLVHANFAQKLLATLFLSFLNGFAASFHSAQRLQHKALRNSDFGALARAAE
jgi:hypothetical protein